MYALAQTGPATGGASTVVAVEIDRVGFDSADDADEESRVDASLADLVEPAKVMALDKLDESGQALRVARGWLRPKLAQESGDRLAFGGAVAATL